MKEAYPDLASCSSRPPLLVSTDVVREEGSNESTGRDRTSRVQRVSRGCIAHADSGGPTSDWTASVQRDPCTARLCSDHRNLQLRMSPERGKEGRKKGAGTYRDLERARACSLTLPA